MKTLHLPKSITFTGADDNTDIGGMLALSSEYPVEWGILLSPTRHGTPRYPSLEKLRDFAFMNCIQRNFRLRMSAHFCGGYSRALIDHERWLRLGSLITVPFSDNESASQVLEDVLLTFTRAQINTLETPNAEAASWLHSWGQSWAKRVILQSRHPEYFPPWTTVDWLFDQSGGEGLTPCAWPTEASNRFVGYAGGIGPENVAHTVRELGRVASNYWIDMESGVRTDDRFDLEKCRAVCEAVYGPTVITRAAA